MITLKDFLSRLPEEEQKKIASRTAELIDEERRRRGESGDERDAALEELARLTQELGEDEALDAMMTDEEAGDLLRDAQRPDGAFMPCFAPDCQVESTHSRGVWVNPEHLRVEYFCEDHAPADATSFEEDEEDEASRQQI